MAFSAMLLVHQNLTLRVSLMHVACALLLELFVFSLVICSGFLCLLWAVSFSLCCQCTSLGPPWAYTESDHMSVRDAAELNWKLISLCCPLKSFLWWLRPAVRPNVCFQPTVRAATELESIIIFPSPWGSSHLGVVLDPTGAACILPRLWYSFGGAPARTYRKGKSTEEQRGRACTDSKIHAGPLWEETCSHLGILLLDWIGLEGLFQQKHMEVGHAVNKLVRECFTMLIPTGVLVSRLGGIGGKWYLSAYCSWKVFQRFLLYSTSSEISK